MGVDTRETKFLIFRGLFMDLSFAKGFGAKKLEAPVPSNLGF